MHEDGVTIQVGIFHRILTSTAESTVVLSFCDHVQDFQIYDTLTRDFDDAGAKINYLAGNPRFHKINYTTKLKVSFFHFKHVADLAR